MPYIWLQDKETGEEIRVPAEWEICDGCRGEGATSAYLGSFSGAEMAEMGQEWCDDYASGAFDRRCEECQGSGKVLIPDEDAMNPRQAAAWQARCEYEAELAQERWRRERGIQY